MSGALNRTRVHAPGALRLNVRFSCKSLAGSDAVIPRAAALCVSSGLWSTGLPVVTDAERTVKIASFAGEARRLRATRGASFRANQGLLLAAALAYYLLLSIVPLLILILWALSRVIDRQHLLATIGTNLEQILPGQSSVLLDELARFSDNHSCHRLGTAGLSESTISSQAFHSA